MTFPRNKRDKKEKKAGKNYDKENSANYKTKAQKKN